MTAPVRLRGTALLLFGATEKFVHRRDQLLELEGLGKELDIGERDAAVDHAAFGVRGEVERLHPGVERSRAPRQLHAAHLAHEEVADHEADGRGFLLSALLKGFLAVLGLQDGVALLGEVLPEERADVLLLLDEKHGAARRHRFRRSRVRNGHQVQSSLAKRSAASICWLASHQLPNWLSTSFSPSWSNTRSGFFGVFRISAG